MNFAWAIPKTYVTATNSSRCTALTSEAKRAMTNREVLQKALSVMKLLDQWTSLTKAYANDDNKQLKFLRAHGSLEVHLAACVLDKKNRTHDKMEDAARQTLQDFSKEVGVALAPPSQWSTGAAKPMEPDSD